MLNILTCNPKFFTIDHAKFLCRKLFRRSKGPEYVLLNLITGLKKIKYPFTLNKNKASYDRVCVLSGLDALDFAIKKKMKGQIKELIVGPNLVVTPLDFDSVILNVNIDKILVPSDWVAKLYSSIAPFIKDKISVWPVGVSDPGEYLKAKDGILIYNKADDLLLKEIVDFLGNKYRVRIIKYGMFEQKKYFNLLKKYKYLIYLSPSESQGIALQEAWIRDVPTFVWNRGYWEYNNKKWLDEKISAPYLVNQAGMFFKDISEFRCIFRKFLNGNYSPRKYCLETLTDEISANKFLEIINKK